jgi:catechol 2,3-dioxygenase-like lactoylglutathione lyase family enzyme
MLDHLSIGVRDLELARRFYDRVFAPLGAALALEKPGELAYGPGGSSALFFLYPVSEAPAGKGAHVAFTAESMAAVDQAYASALAGGATPVRPAGRHPDIGPDYYGAVFLDPDGNKLEVVCQLTMH